MWKKREKKLFFFLNIYIYLERGRFLWGSSHSAAFESFARYSICVCARPRVGVKLIFLVEIERLPRRFSVIRGHRGPLLSLFTSRKENSEHEEKGSPPARRKSMHSFSSSPR